MVDNAVDWIVEEKPVDEWKEEDVADWLVHHGLAEVIPAFQSSNIDGKSLLKLHDQDLDRMGLSVSLGPRQ